MGDYEYIHLSPNARVHAASVLMYGLERQIARKQGDFMEDQPIMEMPWEGLGVLGGALGMLLGTALIKTRKEGVDKLHAAAEGRNERFVGACTGYLSDALNDFPEE
jgi:hypothetical protein